MKNKKAIALLSGALTLIVFAVNAQYSENDMAAFLAAEKSDADKLIGAYVSPLMKGLSYGMTSGWYTTASPHKLFGVDLGVSLSAVMMPTSEETFDPKTLGLSANTTPNFTGNAPTLIGPRTPTTYTVKYGAFPSQTSVEGPEGLELKKNIGMNAIPVPIIQLGIGLIKSTDLKIRYLPEQTQGSTKLKMLGFGLMHDVKQHIPGVKMLPFDLSVLVAYNSVTGSTGLTNSSIDQTDGVPSSTDGKANYTFDSWLIQALISKKVAVLTFYAGLGYAAVSSKASITGHYTLDQSSIVLTDPFSSNYSNNGFKATAGMRLKLGPIYFVGDYTLQKFNALTVGFGVSVR